MYIESTVTLTFNWRELERQLSALADGPAQKDMIPFMVSGLRKQAPFLSQELLLQEILAITACIADARFPTASALASLASATSPASGSSA